MIREPKSLNERVKAGDISYWLNDDGTVHLRGDFSVTELLLMAHQMEDRLKSTQPGDSDGP